MSSTKPVNSIRDGNINIIDGKLEYAVLKNEKFVITQNSLHDFLKTDDDAKQQISYPLESKDLIPYITSSGKSEIGIPIIDVTSYCQSLLEILADNQESITYRQSTILLTFLAAIGLISLIQEDKTRPVIEEQSIKFDDLLGG